MVVAVPAPQIRMPVAFGWYSSSVVVSVYVPAAMLIVPRLVMRNCCNHVSAARRELNAAPPRGSAGAAVPVVATLIDHVPPSVPRRPTGYHVATASLR